MRRVKIGAALCFVAALVALGLWPLSYKKSWGVIVSLEKNRIIASSFNGNLNLSLGGNPLLPPNLGFDFSFHSNSVKLAESGSNHAKRLLKEGQHSMVPRPFGKPYFKIFDRLDLDTFTFQLPHWIVALIFILIGTLWQIFGKRPDDAVETD